MKDKNWERGGLSDLLVVRAEASLPPGETLADAVGAGNAHIVTGLARSVSIFVSHNVDFVTRCVKITTRYNYSHSCMYSSSMFLVYPT